MNFKVKCLCVMTLMVSTGMVAAQDSNTNQQAIEAQLEQLKKEREALDRKTAEFEQRIQALEEQQSAQQATAETPTTNQPTGTSETDTTWGTYQPGKGFVFTSNEYGEIGLSLFTYARYLNQNELNESYTDSFGRTSAIDQRNDAQLQKANISFKGWLFDPKFRFLVYTWTSNTSQGDPAQVVVGGNLGYQFNEGFNLYAGIGALPSTRSTNNTFPNWLKNDHRSIADEYFRGSYTSGIWADGTLVPGLQYRVMAGNNLSQLGVDGVQLDDNFNTLSGAVWWMPTTGEYGPGQGMGDYEFHEEFATLFGIHLTRSLENTQAQPGTETVENSQIRLSDGTRLFGCDPFNTGAACQNGSTIQEMHYQMAAINAGFKYRGWSVEVEAYQRWLDDFKTVDTLPIDDLEDNGFQVQGSMMVIPKTLQAYIEYSKIYGDNGDPSDFTLGANWYPFKRKEMRIQLQALYMQDSPVGYSSVPFAVGGDGWAFTTDWILAF